MKRKRKRKLKPCPNCGEREKDMFLCIGRSYNKHWYFVECPRCGYCGERKVFLWRAILAWNKEKRK